VPKRVFISYRREDTAAAAGRVYDRLSRLLAKPNVFFDVSTIGGGEDFAQKIASEISKSDATLARMPRPEQLPEDIRAITAKNALPLRHESFDDDTENIVAAVLGLKAGERAWEDKGSLGIKIAYAVGAALAVSMLLLLIALLHHWVLGRPLSASIGAPLTTLILIAGAIIGAWLGLRYEARKRKLQ
jgi:hypothetical protein